MAYLTNSATVRWQIPTPPTRTPLANAPTLPCIVPCAPPPVHPSSSALGAGGNTEVEDVEVTEHAKSVVIEIESPGQRVDEYGSEGKLNNDRKAVKELGNIKKRAKLLRRAPASDKDNGSVRAGLSATAAEVEGPAIEGAGIWALLRGAEEGLKVTYFAFGAESQAEVVAVASMSSEVSAVCGDKFNEGTQDGWRGVEVRVSVPGYVTRLIPPYPDSRNYQKSTTAVFLRPLSRGADPGANRVKPESNGEIPSGHHISALIFVGPETTAGTLALQLRNSVDVNSYGILEELGFPAIGDTKWCADDYNRAHRASPPS
ncbi:hypothetical protein FS749_015933 [Ceratobasidium sp. UAMH 11750]|nr:hypothetical protein FS749_015933 [Ceratobasidium sp. UAMH 11750]